MLAIGLTGGIGSGKSTVAHLLAERGAVVIDADALARAVVEPGTPGYDAVVARFGPSYLVQDGSIDRERLAGLVFRDEAALRDLEAIVHPAVAARIAHDIGELTGSDEVVILDVPLLAESARGRGQAGTASAAGASAAGASAAGASAAGASAAGASAAGAGVAGVLVVDTPFETALERLVSERHMERGDVERRMRAQASREDRLAVADFVIDNSGDMAALRSGVDKAWEWMDGLRTGGGRTAGSGQGARDGRAQDRRA